MTARARSGGKARVTMRALMQRIGRKLASEADPRRIRTGRGKNRERFGDYYVLDCTGGVEFMDVNPEKFGRALGVLQEWEQLAEAVTE